MKKLLCFFVCMLVVCAANAAGRGDASRASIAPRATVGTAHLNDFKSSLKFLGENVAAPDTPVPADEAPRDTRDAERVACMSNNGWGMGNTFVWASRFSNTSNYSTMVEDVENPENNVCWVLVGLRSNDGRVNMSDMPTKYFEMGTNITCGSWVDEALVEKRILDAKKSARTLATVAGTVGGAGVGVGAMELFGNKMIGGAVMGQKALSGDDLFVSQLKELKNSKQDADKARYDSVVSMLKSLRDVCSENPSDDCKKVQYATILQGLGE
ncbi:MAG: hypothetical protein J6W41_03080 [Alphaproteobacteria bacterium]|nr:hypothetical protein [Alphaproteobacteria bacterium]